MLWCPLRLLWNPVLQVLDLAADLLVRIGRIELAAKKILYVTDLETEPESETAKKIDERCLTGL